MSEGEVPSVQRIGFTRLSRNVQPEGRSPKANIIFVHGLRGHPESTWSHRRTKSNLKAAESPRRPNRFKTIFRSRSDSSIPPNVNDKDKTSNVFWPRDYLPEDVPEADVWTYGYNADVIGGLFQAHSPKSVSQHGRDLAHEIERRFSDEVPIIFVAHSLGGIVVKDAIRRSELCQSRTRLVMFLGTPHRGSSYAAWGVIATNLAKLAFQDSDKRIIETLAIDNEILDNIHEGFLKILHRANIKIHSFQEARPMTGITGLSSKVVGDFSSKVDSPLFETVEAIDANHREMARCANTNDPRYLAFAGVIKQFMRSMLSSQDSITRESVLVTRIKPPDALSLEEAGPAQDTPVCKAQYYIKLSRNRRFTGRSGILSTLKEKLFVQKETQRLAIVGLGGVGKTQVVLQLAYWVRDEMPDYSVFWVSALGLASFEQAYTEIARQLDIHIKPKDDLKEVVRRYLESDTAGKWLLIIDNADDKEIILGRSNEFNGIYEYLPESENGITVFTTRTREVAVDVAGSDMIELSEMNTDEATEFFEKALFDKKQLRDKGATEKLLQELTLLPLAIVQAAAYLNQNQISIERYLALLQNTEHNMISLMSREFHDNTRYRESKNAVASTWLVSFDQIRRSDSHAAALLAFISCIEWKAIPRSILPELLVEEELEHAIGILCGYTFLTRREEEDMFNMHRLVHVATRVWVQKEEIKDEIDSRAITHLESIFPWANKENRTLWREYMPHAQHALQASQGYQAEARFDLLGCLGNCLRWDRRTKEAIAVLEEAYQWNKQHRSEEDRRRLTVEHRLATAYLDDLRIKEATEILEHVVAVSKRILEEDDEDLLDSEHELAGAYSTDKRVTEAISLFEHVVAVGEKTLAEDDDSRLSSASELARAYMDNNQTTRAIALFESVRAIERQTLAEDDYSRLTTEHNLGKAYLQDGRISEAIEILEHVVAIEEKPLVVDDQGRLNAQHMLADAYYEDNQIDKAIRLCEHVVAIMKKLGRHDNNRLVSEHNLGLYYSKAGRNKEAIELLEHVVAVKKELDMNDEERLVSQRSLTDAYDGDGQLGKAIVLYEHIVCLRRELDTRDERRLTSEHNLANAYIKDGQYQEAIVLLEHVVAIDKESGMSDEGRIVSMKRLADAYLAAGRLKEAIALLEHVVAVHKDLDMVDEKRLGPMRCLAKAYVETQQFGKAIVLLRHAVAVERKLDWSDEMEAHELLAKACAREEHTVLQ